MQIATFVSGLAVFELEILHLQNPSFLTSFLSLIFSEISNKPITMVSPVASPVKIFKYSISRKKLCVISNIVKYFLSRKYFNLHTETGFVELSYGRINFKVHSLGIWF